MEVQGVGANLRGKIEKVTKSIDRSLHGAIRQRGLKRDHGGAAVRIQRRVNETHRKLAKMTKNAKMIGQMEDNQQM